MLSMQATLLIVEQGATSGALEAEQPRDIIVEAHRLACEIERLLTPAANEIEPYGHRLTRALAQNLIDHLDDLARDKRRPKKLARLPPLGG